jgi:hypothetical protein
MKSWILIAVAMVLAACLVLGVLTLLFGNSELARVRLPGSNLTLVLYEDKEGLHRYDVLSGKATVAHAVLLGSRGELAGSPQVSVLGDQVIVTFRSGENTAPFVEFDLAACRITQHSNKAVAPPPIRDCRRR